MFVRVIVPAALAAITAASAVPGSAAAGYSIVSSPNRFSGGNALAGVSASSAEDAWAVGSLCCVNDDSGPDSLALHWNGAAWRAIPGPAAPFGGDSFHAVADLSPTDAWAVGVFNSYYAPLIAHWNGTNWHRVAAPPGITAVLRAISADSARDVWAAGDDGHGRPVVLRYNGHDWSSVPVPLIGYNDMLQGVKAISPSNVWAVGFEVVNDTTFQTTTLVMHWNGTVWQHVPSPNPDPQVDVLHAIAGASAADLWAVGQQGLDEGITGVPPGTKTLTLHWNGTSWHAVSSPNVDDQNTLNGVAAGGGSVVAVGSYEAPSVIGPVSRTLVLRWDGTGWATVPSANAGSTDNALQAAAAVPGSTTVWAVGFRYTSGGTSQTLTLKGT